MSAYAWEEGRQVLNRAALATDQQALKEAQPPVANCGLPMDQCSSLTPLAEWHTPADEEEEPITNPFTYGDVVAMVRGALPDTITLDPAANTGGNCQAVEATSPDGRTLLVTDGDAGLPASSLQDTLVVLSYYDTEQEEAGYVTIPLDRDRFQGNLAASLQAWVEGSPYVDEEYMG